MTAPFFMYHAPFPCFRFSFSSCRTLASAEASTFSRLSLFTKLSARFTARSSRWTSCSRSARRSRGDDASIFLARLRLSLSVVISCSCMSDKKPYCERKRSAENSPVMCRNRGSRGTFKKVRSACVDIQGTSETYWFLLLDAYSLAGHRSFRRHLHRTEDNSLNEKRKT